MKTSKPRGASRRTRRRKAALARFRVMPFNEWLKDRVIHVDGKPVGVMADQQELLDEHEKYCERKAIERAALMKG